MLDAFLECRCYIKLYDSPPRSTTEEDNDKANLPPSQKKKLKQKQRKAEARAKKVSSFSLYHLGTMSHGTLMFNSNP